MKTMNIGVAEGLDFYTITANDIRQALLNVLEDPKYAENAKKASAYFQDQKEKPLDRAIWWAEWVLRNPNNCNYMKSPVPRIGYIVGNSIDIIAFITLALTTVVIFMSCAFYWCCKKMFGSKTVDVKHKKH